MVAKEKISIYGFVLTLLIVGISIIVYSSPQLSDYLVYDRQLILNGEFWRLATAPFVHFSISHVFWNALVFGIAGLAINAFGFRRFWVVCGFSIVVTSLYYLIALPEIGRYGGLSGLCSATVAYFCFCSALTTGKNKTVWLLLLLLMIVKIVVELTIENPIFAQIADTPYRVLPSAHILGFLCAFATVIWTWPSIFFKAVRWSGVRDYK